jgi:hypothetical protein
MTVNTGVKGTLAKLLATEDIVIEHKKCDTASFNVVDRVLVLPIWEKATNEVYDLLVAHEVGHALYTPQDWDNFECPQSYVNVTEDARIEKLMKRRYQGLPKTFYRGYQQFDADDFFSVKGNIDKLNLVDRINLHFKIGAFTPIPINDKYSYIVDMVANAETFEDAIAAAREIWKVTQEEQKEQKKVDDTPAAQGGGDQVDSIETEQSDSQPSQEMDGTGSSGQPDLSDPVGEDDEDGTGDDGADEYDPSESVTDQALSEKLKELTANAYEGNVYLELPKHKVEQFVVDCKKMLDINVEHFNGRDPEILAECNSDYNAFRKQSIPEVNFLLKEFECRKAASMYARASTSRTGVLDTQRLTAYKFSDDIFKKVTVLPEGKNHGMVFILDWSGSMCDYLVDTVNQVLQLVWFCQKANIEYDVYAFTNDGVAWSQLKSERAVLEKNVVSTEWASLLHFASSTQNKRDQELSLKYLYINAGCNGNRPGTHFRKYAMPPAPTTSLSGTPLNESIVFLHTLIGSMKKRAEKVTACILTDGEAAPASYGAPSSYSDDLHRNAVYQRCFLRDRKLGKTYERFDAHPASQTKIFLENLKDNYPDVNILGFRLVAGRDVTTFFRNIFGWNNCAIPMSDYRKNKGCILNDAGYDSYYIMPAQVQTSENDLSELETGVDRATATRAFKKMFKTKRTNKKILTSFIKTVA